jgi:hypothetical protein
MSFISIRSSNSWQLTGNIEYSVELPIGTSRKLSFRNEGIWIITTDKSSMMSIEV